MRSTGREPRRLASLSAIVTHALDLAANGRPSLMAVYIDPNFEHLATDMLGRQDAGTCGIPPERIISHARRIGAFGFALLYHDPDRRSGPSAQELAMTRELRRLGEELDIYLLHHLIVGRDGLKEVAA